MNQTRYHMNPNAMHMLAGPFGWITVGKRVAGDPPPEASCGEGGCKPGNETALKQFNALMTAVNKVGERLGFPPGAEVNGQINVAQAAYAKWLLKYLPRYKNSTLLTQLANATSDSDAASVLATQAEQFTKEFNAATHGAFGGIPIWRIPAYQFGIGAAAGLGLLWYMFIYNE